MFIYESGGLLKVAQLITVINLKSLSWAVSGAGDCLSVEVELNSDSLSISIRNSIFGVAATVGTRSTVSHCKAIQVFAENILT